MVKIEQIKGKNKGKILLYALSTCGWCKKTKDLLDNFGVEYFFIYVDLVDEKEKDKIMDEVRKWNSFFSFPTIVINDKKSIVGFKENEIREALGL